MTVRYVPASDLVVGDRQGVRRIFKAHHVRPDGTLGYSEEEVAGLYRDHLASFRKVEVEIIEQATAAPGEKRTRKTEK